MVTGSSVGIGRAGKAALLIMEGQERMELTTGNSRVQTLWVKIKVQANNEDVIMGACYRPSRHNNDINSSSN